MKKYVILGIIITIFISCNTKMTGTFTDKRDGKIYKTIKIGDQVWLAENFAFKADTGCWAYDNDQSNIAKYGYLYDWETAKQIVPEGWHLPTEEEYETMLNNCGLSKEEIYRAVLIGGKSNFNAIFAGQTQFNKFYFKDQTAFFWTSTNENEIGALAFWVTYKDIGDGLLGIGFTYKNSGNSVRLVKD